MTYAQTCDVFVVPPHLTGHPEVVAMLGAYFSRSYRPMRKRVQELGEDTTTHRDKIRQYVVGYGHDSILDMANVAISIEDVPILAAVAIEDHPLFAGQETSTRYVDWSTEQFVNPVDPAEHPLLHMAVLDHYQFLRDTYSSVTEGVRVRITIASGLDPDDLGEHGDEVRQAVAAIKARKFDVSRGFLPAGAVTRVCWNGRLSSMKQHLRDLAIHPDPEIIALAYRIWRELHVAYPDAMGDAVIDRPTDVGYRTVRWNYDGLNGEYYWNPRLDLDRHDLPLKWTAQATDALRRRKWCEPVPAQAYMEWPDAIMTGMLDFGSMRDLHRHRRGTRVFTIPRMGQNQSNWYMNMAEGAIDVKRYLRDLDDSLARVKQHVPKAWPTERQDRVMAHCMPLATEIPVMYQMDVPQLTYLLERRTTMDVHATLREMMLACANQIGVLPHPIHVTRTPDPGRDGYILRRGKQTITVNGRDIAEEGR